MEEKESTESIKMVKVIFMIKNKKRYRGKREPECMFGGGKERRLNTLTLFTS